MGDVIFQDIFDALQDDITVEWAGIVFYAGYSDNSYSMKYYVCGTDGHYMSCFDLPGADLGRITKLFSKINGIISESRKKLDDSQRWSVLTMLVGSDGDMKAFFDYPNLNENRLEYEKEWKAKYIK